MKESMLEIFKGYSKYSEGEYKEIWNQGLIVIDTNILLNFYRYSNETREELYKALEAMQDRLWIPYQVAYEYFNNKKTVIVDTYKSFDELLNETKNCFSKLSNTIKSTATKQLKCKDSVIEKLDNSYKEIHRIISEEKESKKENASEEKVEELIFKLFNNSIGERIANDEYEKIKKEGLNRIQNKLPPGYKDSDKEENGDYYIFYSMIKYSKENQKHIIFVTDDTKEDWFIRILGEKKGGDYRLLNEFYRETGKLLLIYSSDGFLRAYNENINKSQKLDEKVLDELINTRKSEMKKDNILNRKYKNEDIIRNLRNVLLHYPVNDTIILNELERSRYELQNIDSNLREALDILYLAYKNNDERLRNEALHELEKYLDFSYNEKYSYARRMQYERKLRRITQDIDYFIKYNKELDLNNFCERLDTRLSYLLNTLKELGNDKKNFLLIDKIKSLKGLLHYAKDDESIDEKFIKIYLPSQIQETLDFIKEQIKFIA